MMYVPHVYNILVPSTRLKFQILCFGHIEKIKNKTIEKGHVCIIAFDIFEEIYDDLECNFHELLSCDCVSLFIDNVSFIRLMMPSAGNGFIIRSQTTFHFKSTSVVPLSASLTYFVFILSYSY